MFGGVCVSVLFTGHLERPILGLILKFRLCLFTVISAPCGSIQKVINARSGFIDLCLLTSISVTGCHAVGFSPSFLCHCRNWDVQVKVVDPVPCTNLW